jgi:hypothetical protein
MPVKTLFFKKVITPYAKILIIFLSISTILSSQSNTSSTASQEVFTNGKQHRILVEDDNLYLLSVVDNKLQKLNPQEDKPETIKEFVSTQRIIISKHGEFIGVLNRVYPLAYTFELRRRKDIDNTVFTIDDTTYRTFYLAPQGKFVVGVKVMDGFPTPSTKRTYTFYSSEGLKKATVGPYITKRKELSPDGSILVLNTRNQGLIAFNKSGTELWQIPGNFSHIKVSNRAEITVATSEGEPYVLSIFKNGKAPKSIQLHKKCLGIAVSDNGKHASFSDKDDLNYVGINEGQITWRRPFEGGEEATATVTISNKGPIAFSTERKVPPQGNIPAHFASDKIFLYSATGTKAWEKDASYSYYEGRPPLLKFSPGEPLSLYFCTPTEISDIDCNTYLKVK